jgi:hypothetical protein
MVWVSVKASFHFLAFVIEADFVSTPVADVFVGVVVEVEMGKLVEELVCEVGKQDLVVVETVAGVGLATII